MKRRKFVKNVGLASVAMPVVLKNVQYQVVNKKLFNYAKSAEDRVLIVIRLNGGNDGLNTVIPRDQYDNLFIQRENVIIPENDILPLTANVGLHPSMTGMKGMFDNGKMGIIQNVGYPEQNRSHFRSMDIWTSGDTETTQNRGWLGRYLDSKYPDYPDSYPNPDYPDPFAISMGYQVSETCQGLMANFSHVVADPFDDFTLSENPGAEDGTYFGSHMEYLNNLIVQTNAYGAQINDAANAGSSLSTMYDENNPIAVHLRNVAKMISGGLQTKVYILNIDQFDTHDSQVVGGATATGLHADLLQTLSDAVAAFQDDLALLGLEQRVAGMTFSEFGRQIASNYSFGTDHGDAAPLFLFGACISNGITGSNPVISDQVVNQAGVPMQIDFRDVYASILKDWFEVDEAEVESLFNHTVNFLPVLGACNTGIEELEEDVFAMNVYPNPAINNTNLELRGDGSRTAIQVFDIMGRKVKEVFEGELQAQNHTIPIELNGINAGQYLIVVQSEKGKSSKSLVIAK